MNRTSFAGALVAVALGAVLAFALQSTPHDLNLHVTGLIIMIAGLADLAVRFLIADSPLLSTRAAAVAAVVEPLGEPVLDVFGNPIVPATTPTGADPYGVAPAGAAAVVPMVEEPVYADYPDYADYLDYAGYADDTRPPADLGPQQELSHGELTASEQENRERAMAHARARDQAFYEQALAAAGDEVPGPAMPATTLAGRPVRPRRRRRIAP